MTISTIDPATPDPGDPAGAGDDQIRALKSALVNQFAGQAGDLFDIPITVGPRAINAVGTKADQSAVDAVAADVSANGLAISALQSEDSSLDARITALENATPVADALEAAWPVGSVFVSFDGGTPTAKGLPGTWSAVGDGRVLLGGTTGFGTTGGSMSVNLSIAQLPAHGHPFRIDEDIESSVSSTQSPKNGGFVVSPSALNPATTVGPNNGTTSSTEGEQIGAAGSGDPVDITPAHVVVRFFQRTA